MTSDDMEQLLAIPTAPLSQDQRRLNHLILHRLWTLALGSPTYKKADWIAIEGQLVSGELLP